MVLSRCQKHCESTWARIRLGKDMTEHNAADPLWGRRRCANILCMKKNLGPLTKAPKQRFEISPNAKILIRQILIGLAVVTTVVLLLTAVWHLTRLPSLTISTVTAAGGETIEASAVVAAVEAELSGTYGKFIPKRFFLFYPQNGVRKAAEGVERVRDVLVERVSMTEIAVTYGEHTPYALWCKEESVDECLFLNDQGYAYATAPHLDGGNFVRYHQAALAPAVGSSVLPADDFWNTISLTKLLAADNIFVAKAEVDEAGDVYYILTTGGEIRATLRDEAKQVAENVRTVLSTKEFSHLRSSDFNYLDVRFGNKVYVSEFDVATLAAASSTASSTEVVGADSAAIATLSAPAPEAASTTIDSATVRTR